MSTTNQIANQLAILLTRVRYRSIGIEEAEHALESISCDMLQLGFCTEAQWIAKQYGVIPTPNKLDTDLGDYSKTT